MDKYKVNNNELSKWNITTIESKTITREEAIQELGEDLVNELDRDVLLGVHSSVVVEHKSIVHRLLHSIVCLFK
jgi:hypothetical protein